MDRSARIIVVTMAIAAGSCGGAARDAAVPASGQRVAAVASVPMRDSRVGDAAYDACLVADSLLRKPNGAPPAWSAAIPLDSIWPDTTHRWACRVRADGNATAPSLAVDSVMNAFTARGWRDGTMWSADGPDGTVLGVHRGGVICAIRGSWDGGDDSDTTYVPTGDFETHVACTALVAGDTVATTPEPPSSPARPITGTLIRPMNPSRP